jgi:hypothetical protein
MAPLLAPPLGFTAPGAETGDACTTPQPPLCQHPTHEYRITATPIATEQEKRKLIKGTAKQGVAFEEALHNPKNPEPLYCWRQN